jgi:catechol 2,3-dioxygenase-like lactoylglutathione lyase family enzyme
MCYRTVAARLRAVCRTVELNLSDTKKLISLSRRDNLIMRIVVVFVVIACVCLVVFNLNNGVKSIDELLKDQVSGGRTPSIQYAFFDSDTILYHQFHGRRSIARHLNKKVMLTEIHPKLPMRDKTSTRAFYVDKLGFTIFGGADYPDYLMVQREGIQIHFFLFQELNPKENYGQVYVRTDDIDSWYQFTNAQGVKTTKLEVKPWGQKEFSILDPDNNLLIFGQGS